MSAAPETDALVLAMLVNADGAILCWQVPAISDDGSWGPAHAFEDALGRGVIRFDADSDCYVHLAAKSVGDDEGFTLDDITLARWYEEAVGYDIFADAARADPPESPSHVREIVREAAGAIARGQA